MAKNWLEMVEKRLLIIPHLFRLIIEGRHFRLFITYSLRDIRIWLFWQSFLNIPVDSIQTFFVVTDVWIV